MQHSRLRGMMKGESSRDHEGKRWQKALIKRAL
jgi:hypothetical protein